jgi:transcriptional regulator with XRE-family HTH domain
MNLFQKNLTYLMKIFHVRQAQLASHVGKAPTTIGNWLGGDSEPNIEGLVKIVQYFGVSLDDLIFTDIEKGKLITNEHLAEFQKNGKLNGKGIGKVLAGRPHLNKESEVREDVSEWAILNALKIIDGKVDQVITSLGKSDKKGTP